MKRTIYSSQFYFDANSKTIILTGVGSIDLSRLYMIVDTTVNKFIYSFADSTVGTVTVNGPMITFTASNTGMANSDDLLIVYDVPEADCMDEAEKQYERLDRIANLLEGIVIRLDYLNASIDSHYEPPVEEWE